MTSLSNKFAQSNQIVRGEQHKKRNNKYIPIGKVEQFAFEQLSAKSLQALSVNNHYVFHRENSEYAQPLIRRVPLSLNQAAIVQYRALYADNRAAEANLYISEAAQAAKHPILNIIPNGIQATHKDIKTSGMLIVDVVRDILFKWNPGESKHLRQKAIMEIEQTLKVKITGEKQSTKIMRALDPNHWIKVARKTVRQLREIAHIKIDPASMRYCSIDALNESRTQDHADQQYRKTREIINNQGDRFDMPTTEQAANSKRAEMITRCKGIAQLADLKHLKPKLVTLTCPSKYHPNSDKYAGLTPLEGQQHLNSCWAKARKRLKKHDIDFEFIRTAEPHKDSCVHWHLVLWSSDWDKTKKILMDTFLKQHEPNEAGAKKRRVQIDDVKGGSGGAVAYAIKYVAKHTVGIEGESDTADRVKAWRRTWNIRAFATSQSQISVWRYLRKMKQTPEGLAEIIDAAQAGEYANFILLNKELEIKPDYSLEKNRYNEEVPIMVGIKRDNISYINPTKWTITKKQKVTLNTKEPRLIEKDTIYNRTSPTNNNQTSKTAKKDQPERQTIILHAVPTTNYTRQ